MSLSYVKLSRHSMIFRRLTGLEVRTFNKIVDTLKPEWEKIEHKKKCHGRRCHIQTLEDKILCLVLYYRTYVSHVMLGYLFNVHDANICRLFKKIEPLFAGCITIKKDRSLTPEKVLEVIADVLEQPTQRPKRKQRRYYSGKKKSHTLKAEIIIDASGKIMSVSQSHKGRIHDFKIRKGERLLSPCSIKYADSGYQGWQKLQSNVVIPFKKSKKKPLNAEQKQHNKNLASFRIRVEHKIREIKVFKIMSDRYRNFQKKHGMRLNIVAGMVNLKHGF
jgi:hypothetical protein